MRTVIVLTLAFGLMGCGGNAPVADERGGGAKRSPEQQAKDDADKEELAKLKTRASELKADLAKKQKEMGVPEFVRQDVARGKTTPKDSRRHFYYVNDNTQYKETYNQLATVVADYNRILDRHPDWNVPAMREELDDEK